jgi:hypothetical protein
MSEKIKYEQPKLINLNVYSTAAMGACYAGRSASGICGPGTTASTQCQGPGSSATGACQSSGSTARGCTGTGGVP